MRPGENVSTLCNHQNAAGKSAWIEWTDYQGHLIKFCTICRKDVRSKEASVVEEEVTLSWYMRLKMRSEYFRGFVSVFEDIWRIMGCPQVHAILTVIGLVILGMAGLIKLGFYFHVLPR